MPHCEHVCAQRVVTEMSIDAYCSLCGRKLATSPSQNKAGYFIFNGVFVPSRANSFLHSNSFSTHPRNVLVLLSPAFLAYSFGISLRVASIHATDSLETLSLKKN